MQNVYPENLRNIPNPPAFLPEVRSAMEHLLERAKLYDVYRTLHPEGISYTWWSNRMHKRRENRGWRLDYFLVSRELIGDIKHIRHRTDIYGSDHCPVELSINLWRPKPVKSISDENAAEMWRGIDWGNMEQQLLSFQKKLIHAVYAGNEEMRIDLQKRIVRSMAAKVLAVRHVVSVDSAAGIDGVKWETDEEKMKAAMSLTSKGYHARPYRQIIIEDKVKLRTINVPTAYDKAMQMLYAYALDPVAEATGDLKSFAFRRGRSTFDCHSYICEMLDGDNAPEWYFKGDVKSCYDTISHKWLLQNIPMDRKVLSEFLRAGAVMNGILFPTNNGISQGGSLSPIIGNMVLDGLQKFLLENLCPEGEADSSEGQVVRFADDIFITAKSRSSAENIKRLVLEFLAARGLRLSEEKSKIGNVYDGFAFLSRWYCKKDGYLDVKPARNAVRIIEEELEQYILNYKGNIQKFINGLNRKLGGWGRYHRITTAHEDFEHIDKVVQSFLLKKTKSLHPKRQLGHITAYYWYEDIWGRKIFADPNNRRISVLRLADMQIITHKPVKTTFNPYLDQEYYQTLVRRREINRIGSAEYKAIWQRQQGLCFLCGQAMLPDHELDIIHFRYGPTSAKPLAVYTHKRRAYGNTIEYISEISKEATSIVDVLEDVLNSDIQTEDPYYHLRLFFINAINLL